MKEMNVLSINDQDFEVVDGAGRSGLTDLVAYSGGGSLIGTASADCSKGEKIEVNAADAPVHKCVVNYEPIQAGTIGADPTPENPKEFISTSFIRMNRSSENLYKYDDCQLGYRLDDQGNLVANANSFITDFIEVNDSIVYGGISSTYNCAWYDENKSYVSSFTITATGTGTRTVSCPSGVKYARFSCSQTYKDSFVVFATAPFNDSIYFTASYHFSLDVLNGKLVEPDVYCTLQDQQDLAFTMTESADYTTFSADITDYFPTIKADGFAKIFCDKFKGYDSETTNTNNIFLKDGVLNIRVTKDKWASAADFLTWVRTNGINMLIELATADENTVGSIALQTISGKNVIWASMGLLEIEYYKNTTIVSDFITLINDLYPEE